MVNVSGYMLLHEIERFGTEEARLGIEKVTPW